MKLSEIAVLAEKVKSNIQKVIVGGESNLDLLLTALICGSRAVTMFPVPARQ